MAVLRCCAGSFPRHKEKTWKYYNYKLKQKHYAILLISHICFRFYVYNVQKLFPVCHGTEDFYHRFIFVSQSLSHLRDFTSPIPNTTFIYIIPKLQICIVNLWINTCNYDDIPLGFCHWHPTFSSRRTLLLRPHHENLRFHIMLIISVNNVWTW